MFIIILLLSILTLLLCHYYVHHGRNGRLINLIPGPPCSLISGNALEFIVSPEQWKLLHSILDKYYPIARIWGFFRPLVSIRHPDDMEKILSSTKHIEKSIIYHVLHPWFGTGLLTSTGTKWQSRRKILTPAFHFNILNHFVDILIKESDHMIKSLKNEEGIIVKDLIPFISEHTLNAICETAMGISLHDLGAFQQKYREAVHQIIELMIYRLVRIWLHNDLIFALTPTGRRQKKVLKILHGFTEKKKKRLAMLDLLIAASQEGLLTDLDIREEVDTFMFEERVRTEVNIVMKENEGKLTIRSMQNLLYLDRCLKETLRLYPSVFFISRFTAEDVKLQSYVIPAGTAIHLNIYGVHRDSNFWPNPEVFDPDRFLPERILNRHPYCYLPFSAGPRNCIGKFFVIFVFSHQFSSIIFDTLLIAGQRFGLLEMKAIIAPLVRNFYLEPIDYLKDLRIRSDLILRPSHPLHMKFIPIKC
ncbi:hypothetical protein ACFW04_005037 [Cataglyphis niger]